MKNEHPHMLKISKFLHTTCLTFTFSKSRHLFHPKLSRMPSIEMLVPVLILLSCSQVFSLKCYVNNFKQITEASVLLDCSDSQYQTLTGKPPLAKDEKNLTCYIVAVKSDEGPDYYDADMSVRGCLTKGGCTGLYETFTKFPFFDGDEVLRCFECDRDGCNKDPPPPALNGAASALFWTANILAAIVFLL